MSEKNNTIQIASFDIGKKNFAFLIEEINLDEIEKDIKNIEKNNRYNVDGTCKKEFQDILHKVYKNGKVILIKNLDITINCDKKKYLDKELFYNMIDALDEYKEYWKNVSYFVVEKQLQINPTAVRLSVVCMSFFMFYFGRFKKVVEFDAYYKTTTLGTKKDQKKLKSGKIKYVSISKPERKKWAIEQASYILTEREDFKTLSELVSSKKKDDMSDVLCQLQAFKYLYFVDKNTF
jgi:hypothetical protein